MNYEWSSAIISLISLYVGYRLGLRSQKKEVLREYVTEIVKDKYPRLYSEINRNLQYLNGFLDKPDVQFEFPEVNGFFDKGLDAFMEEHHEDLFLELESFKEHILTRFRGLINAKMDVKRKIADSWKQFLADLFSERFSEIHGKIECEKASERIVYHLIKTINPNYVFPDLLTERFKEAQNKIEECIEEQVTISFGKRDGLNVKEISKTLIESAKLEVVKLLDMYNELRKQDENVIWLLSLLRSYIATPF